MYYIILGFAEWLKYYYYLLVPMYEIWRKRNSKQKKNATKTQVPVYTWKQARGSRESCFVILISKNTMFFFRNLLQFCVRICG